MWRFKIVSIGTDGTRMMTGRISGVQKRLEEATNYLIVRIWCGLQKIDQIAQQECEALCNDTFILILTIFITYLWFQKNLQTKMKTTCPNFVSTQWLSMKRITSWLNTNCVRVTE